MAMKTNRFIAILVLFSFFLGANAKKKEKDYPLSEIKVGYTYHYKFLRGSDGIVEKDYNRQNQMRRNSEPDATFRWSS